MLASILSSLEFAAMATIFRTPRMTISGRMAFFRFIDDCDLTKNASLRVLRDEAIARAMFVFIINQWKQLDTAIMCRPPELRKRNGWHHQST